MSDSAPLVSVVIPAYGVSDYIAETLRSVLCQSVRDFEILVVNDCCPDSERLRAAISPFLTQLHYIEHDTNRGVSAARNTALRAARGELVAFLDGDDVWELEYLATQLQMLKEDPDACLVYGNARIVGSLYEGTLSQSQSPSVGPVTVTSMLDERVSVASLNMTRKNALFAVGLFDESLRRCEDFDLWLRIAKWGGKIIYHSKVIAGYRIRSGSLTRDSAEMFRDRLCVLKKLKRETILSAEEQNALRNAEIRWTALMNLELSKRAFAAGDNVEASRFLRSANLYLKRPRLDLVRRMMTSAPGFLRLVMRIRQKALGF